MADDNLPEQTTGLADYIAGYPDEVAKAIREAYVVGWWDAVEASRTFTPNLPDDYKLRALNAGRDALANAR